MNESFTATPDCSKPSFIWFIITFCIVNVNLIGVELEKMTKNIENSACL